MSKYFLHICFFCCLLLFTKHHVCAQVNLIYNGDFEIYDTCPSGTSIPGDMQMEHCIGWRTANLATPDYFNSCALFDVNVPNTFVGYQDAFCGNGFMGMISYMAYNGWREYIQSKLDYCMEKDAIYHVEFYVCIADNSRYGINTLGAFFSNDALFQTTPDYIDVQTQIYNSPERVIVRSMGWTKISGTYKAKGGECYITIGNFSDWADTDTLVSNIYSNNGTYIYIDCVSVIQCDTCNVTTYVPNIFSPNNDGNNDILFVRGKNINQIIFSIYNRWGEQVFTTSDKNFGWDGTYRGKLCDAGVYVYYLTVNKDGYEKIKKGNITLIR